MKKTNIDSPFYRTMGKIGDLLFANLLWLVCCLPIVTAGASTLGLFTVVNKMAAKEDYTVHTDFFMAFPFGWRAQRGGLLADALEVLQIFVDEGAPPPHRTPPAPAFWRQRPFCCWCWRAAAAAGALPCWHVSPIPAFCRCWRTAAA